MLSELLTVIQEANAGYYATYEEASMMNIAVDYLPNTDPDSLNTATMLGLPEDVPSPLLGFAYIEEFQTGKYERKFVTDKTTRVQIWFCKASPFSNTAANREALRAEIESEIVFPFIGLMQKSTKFAQVSTWAWATPPARFDMNEVSIMLEAELREVRVC